MKTTRPTVRLAASVRKESTAPKTNLLVQNSSALKNSRDGPAEVKADPVDGSKDSSQFRIIRSVRADVPMLNNESSYDNLSVQNSHQDLPATNTVELGIKYNESSQRN